MSCGVCVSHRKIPRHANRRTGPYSACVHVYRDSAVNRISNNNIAFYVRAALLQFYTISIVHKRSSGSHSSRTFIAPYVSCPFAVQTLNIVRSYFDISRRSSISRILTASTSQVILCELQKLTTLFASDCTLRVESFASVRQQWIDLGTWAFASC